MPAASRYNIEKLLAEGVQPFDDIDDVMLKAIADGLAGAAKRRQLLTTPVILSRDLLVIDGHQRLRAMRLNGAVYIKAEDIRIDMGVTAENALEAAVGYNVKRRHISVEEKARAARRFQRENGWSQRKIADVFGVSQPAVSQWFAADDEEGPDEITGEDGKRYPARRRRRPQVPEAPGIPDWLALAGQLVTMLPVHWEEVPTVHRAEARSVLEDLALAITAQIAAPEAPVPFD